MVHDEQSRNNGHPAPQEQIRQLGPGFRGFTQWLETDRENAGPLIGRVVELLAGYPGVSLTSWVSSYCYEPCRSVPHTEPTIVLSLTGPASTVRGFVSCIALALNLDSLALRQKSGGDDDIQETEVVDFEVTFNPDPEVTEEPEEGVGIAPFTLVVKREALSRKCPYPILSFFRKSRWGWQMDRRLCACPVQEARNLYHVVALLEEYGMQCHSAPVDFYILKDNNGTATGSEEPSFLTLDDGALEFCQNERGGWYARLKADGESIGLLPYGAFSLPAPNGAPRGRDQSPPELVTKDRRGGQA